MDMKKRNNRPTTDYHMISIGYASLTISPTSLHIIKRRQGKHLQMKAGPLLTLLRVGDTIMTLWAVILPAPKHLLMF